MAPASNAWTYREYTAAQQHAGSDLQPRSAVAHGTAAALAIMKTIAFIVLFACSRAALALGEPVANTSSILGCWKRHVYSAEAMNRISTFDIYDPVQQRYQWFCFRENGDFRVLTLNKDAELSSKELDNYLEASPAAMRWKLLGLGVVSITAKHD